MPQPPLPPSPQRPTPRRVLSRAVRRLSFVIVVFGVEFSCPPHRTLYVSVQIGVSKRTLQFQDVIRRSIALLKRIGYPDLFYEPNEDPKMSIEKANAHCVQVLSIRGHGSPTHFYRWKEVVKSCKARPPPVDGVPNLGVGFEKGVGGAQAASKWPSDLWVVGCLWDCPG